MKQHVWLWKQVSSPALNLKALARSRTQRTPSQFWVPEQVKQHSCRSHLTTDAHISCVMAVHSSTLKPVSSWNLDLEQCREPRAGPRYQQITMLPHCCTTSGCAQRRCWTASGGDTSPCRQCARVLWHFPSPYPSGLTLSQYHAKV